MPVWDYINWKFSKIFLYSNIFKFNSQVLNDEVQTLQLQTLHVQPHAKKREEEEEGKEKKNNKKQNRWDGRGEGGLLRVGAICADIEGSLLK